MTDSSVTHNQATTFVKGNGLSSVVVGVAVGFLSLLTYSMGFVSGEIKGFHEGQEVVKDRVGESHSTSTPAVNSEEKNAKVGLYAARLSNGQPEFFISYSFNYGNFASIPISPDKVLTAFTDADLDRLKTRTVESIGKPGRDKMVTPHELDQLIRVARQSTKAK